MKRIIFNPFLVGAALVGQAWAQPVLNDLPSRIVGQPSINFRSTNPNVVEGREFFNPLSVVTDRSSNPQPLFVSDFANNRVLGWSNAATFSNGAPADIVIGQLDKVSTLPLGPGTVRATGVALPGALAVDTQGNLYVADLGNNRILRFPKPFAQPDEVKVPDMVIGQPTFNTNEVNQGGVSERSLAFNVGGSVRTSGLAFDTQGNLWVSDPGNHRLLRYPVAALTAGASRPAADLVLGQPNFTTNTSPAGGSGARLNKAVLASPSGVGVDSQGNVFTADAFSRVVVYTPGFFNGKEASRVLGVAVLPAGEQPVANATNMLSPQGVFMVGDRPGVTDPAWHRITIYDPLREWPAETAEQPSPPARIVIGQSDFNSSRANRQLSEPSPVTVAGPQSAFYNGSEFFVADTANHRILAYPQVVSNASATRVLGQLNFNFNAANLVDGRELFLYSGISENNNLAGAFSDGAGVVIDIRANPPRLYVADTFNNRVLGFRDARIVRPGDKADIVIGQSDFNRVMVNAPQNNSDIQTDQGLFRPSGLAVDRNGDLFVADSGNGRVLRFAQPFANVPPAGERYRANLVIGQASAFGPRITDPSSRSMAYPFGLVFTAEGHLLVSDAVHHRVLFFRRPAGGDFTTGMAAEKVIGQPDFFTGTRGTGNNRLFSPRHISIDTDDRLYVADAGNNRIVMYDRIPGAPNDPVPAFSLPAAGNPQGVFVSTGTGEIWVASTRQNRLSRYPRFELLPITTNPQQNIPSTGPLGLAQDGSGNLYVAEANNRVAIFFNGVTHQLAGSYADRPISPGGIAILYPRARDKQFTTETRSFNELPNPLPLPKEIADLQVLLNDQPVPLYFVSPGQINFLVPMNTPTSGRADVQVIKPSTGEIVAAGNIDLAIVSPALFIQGNADQGQIAALNEDNSVNGPGNQAQRGTVIQLFGTGQGFVPNAPADGSLVEGQLPTEDKPRVLIGTRFVDDAMILYSGLAPGLVGVWQINVRIPNDDTIAPSPQVDVVVQFKSVPSNQGFQGKRLVTTIAIRP
jgi:uncharacterized protein (TIGR03437 family)